MADLIAFPFRLDVAGEVITHETGSDELYAAELAMLCMTRVEERELVPDYGITDPVFSEFDEVEFLSQVELFGPPVDITNIIENPITAGQMTVVIEFDASAFDDEEDDESSEVQEVEGELE